MPVASGIVDLLGRLVYTYAGLPAIRCSTGPGEKFRAAERGDVVAFESDNAELDRRLGWTVVLDAVSVTHLRYRVLS
jgi:acetamidase/formamidase